MKRMREFQKEGRYIWRATCKFARKLSFKRIYFILTSIWEFYGLVMVCRFLLWITLSLKFNFRRNSSKTRAYQLYKPGILNSLYFLVAVKALQHLWISLPKLKQELNSLKIVTDTNWKYKCIATKYLIEHLLRDTENESKNCVKKLKAMLPLKNEYYFKKKDSKNSL